jgi:hypothetical protein
MRGRRFLTISLLAIFMAIGVSVGSASEFVTEDWGGAWFKIKAKFSAVCEIADANKLLKDSDKESAWIYIETGTVVELDETAVSYLVIKGNGEWEAYEVPLDLLVGSGQDVVFATVDFVEFPVEDGTIFINYIFRLTAKKGKLEKARLTNVAGVINLLGGDEEEECWGTLTLSGKYAKKVPIEVEAAVLAEGGQLPED